MRKCNDVSIYRKKSDLVSKYYRLAIDNFYYRACYLRELPDLKIKIKDILIEYKYLLVLERRENLEETENILEFFIKEGLFID